MWDGSEGRVKLWPHLSQKLFSGGFSVLHLGQTSENPAPHLPQKMAPSLFSYWHFGHFIIDVPQKNKLRKDKLNIFRMGVFDKGRSIIEMSFIVKSDSTIYCGIEIFCLGFVFLPYSKVS